VVVCLELWFELLRIVFCGTLDYFASYGFRCSRCTASNASSSPIPGGEVLGLLAKIRDGRSEPAKAIPYLGGSS